MRSRNTLPLIATFTCALACASASHQAAIPPTPGTPTGSQLQAKTAGMERRDGFIPLYLDAKQGKIYLEIPRDSTRALLMITQATGLGSNPIGIDRGSSGATDVVRFDRDGEFFRVTIDHATFY